MLRLLIVTFDPPTGSGGIEGRTAVYTHIFNLRRLHVEVAAVGSHERGSKEPYQGTRLVRLSSSPAHTAGTLFVLVRMMASSAVDTVFFLSGGSTLIGILTLGFCRLSRRTAGVFFYGKDVLQLRKRPGGSLVLALSILLAGRVATNSRYTAKLLPVRPKGHTSIVYPGVDPDIPTSTLGISRDERTPRVLFVGRLVRRKGADLLMSAFAQVRLALPSAKLDVVGDGPEMEILQKLARTLQLNEAVTFYGALYGPPLWRRYAEASVFVLPSRQSKTDVEGFGTVFLEAGIFGVPSVSTRTGGIPEAVIDGLTGKLVDDEDVEGLQQAIKGLLEDRDERQRLGANARARALKLSWESSSNQVLGFLGEDGP
jgi:glycosyltransferase involved in cell wall biosynthesis